MGTKSEQRGRLIPASDDLDGAEWLTRKEMESLCPACAQKMRKAGISKVRLSCLPFDQMKSRRQCQKRNAAAWDKKPKGWTDDSLEKYWKSLTGDRKHKITACMKKMKDKIDNPGAFCASLARKLES